MSVPESRLLNMNIAKTSLSIKIKFHQECSKDRGLASFSFGPDRIRTFVFMATDNSHRVLMDKLLCDQTSSFIFVWLFFLNFLQVTRKTIKSPMGLKLDKIRPGTKELAALERLENPHILIMGEVL